MANGSSEVRYDPVAKKFINGRKTTYWSEAGEILIDYASRGKSVNSFCVDHRVPRSTVNSWLNTHPEFQDSFDLAKQAYCVWYEENLNKQITGELKGSTQAVIFALKAFCGYRDSEPAQTNIQVNYDSLPDEQKIRVLQEALKQIESGENK